MCTIIKSYFCFKDKKTQLINISHNFINKDISIERILKKIYKLENIYYLLSEKNKINIKKTIYKNKIFKEINKMIFQIKDETKTELNSKEILNNT